MKRITSIDIVRGLVVMLMALDHTRELLHTTSLTMDPTDLTKTYPILFFTRWITHFCAPIFVFLAGTSVFLMREENHNISQTTLFLRSRGIWLMLLELTIVGFGIWFDLFFRTVMLQVIFAIGFGFVCLSFLLKLPVKIVGLLGLLIVFLHNLLPTLIDPVHPLSPVLRIAFFPGFYKISNHFSLLIAYPVVPWLGIMLAGYGMAPIFKLQMQRRNKILCISGMVSLVLFVSLRLGNFYGDPAPWSPQNSFVFTLLSFLNLTKYPPSLFYALLTLGVMFLLLAFSQKLPDFISKIIITFGRVPLFFYIIHWYLIHLSMLGMVYMQGFAWKDLSFGTFGFGRPAKGGGLELPWIFTCWIILLIIMYPLCKWFGEYKAIHKEKKWLGYL